MGPDTVSYKKVGPKDKKFGNNCSSTFFPPSSKQLNVKGGHPMHAFLRVCPVILNETYFQASMRKIVLYVLNVLTNCHGQGEHT